MLPFRKVSDKLFSKNHNVSLKLQGFDAAVAAGAREVAIFASASEAFSKLNINCSIAESLARYRVVADAARKLAIPIRGYVLFPLLNISSHCIVNVFASISKVNTHYPLDF